MSGLDISYAGALGGGILSFVSPCVLPLVPAYLCFLGGTSLEQLSGEETAETGASRRVVISALLFILGFSSVFVALGASASAISGILLENKLILGQIAGIIIITFGLHVMGLLRLPFLNREVRLHLQNRPASLVGAYVLGLAFAFGWTPCIGPILATVLSVAARGDSLWYGTSLLFAYAAGLGIPFLLAAFLAAPFLRWMKRMRKHMRRIELATGGLLIVTGLLFLFNSFEILGFWLIEALPILGEIG
ncbi:MAG: cytochrome c biogenesis protein CcdA [Rhodospirillaceae bacterium]|jgi:cytochrome c-type biogenesis protein|nr:cytochrome c biogenesis protein CcdA [Rhodospirillaceae bacterium]MBT4045181.1 cytochrome c biogenesis protein CcdA [Rhodospirillaceae bacterium]MBT4490550.1 cytochrome c biogenesis protein CcdA [Rhodospirillaceae bacterium]MBT5191683.1 cytochrome c biogenesis protein CcdA [Rhodospirillaceae bacterium]MBT5895033.1 cytochrome c biogenesis protein CcdA [Rhodospirillaceae bacterium]